MKKVLIPVIAGMAIVGAATAQQQETKPRLDARPEMPARPEMRVHRFETFIGPSSFLGVYPADVTDEKAKELGMTETYGALLTEIVKESPAEAAGLRKNDVVISWNGTRVESAAALRRMVVETPAGRDVRIGYVRAGARQELDAKIGDRPQPTEGMMNGLQFKPEQFKDFMKDAPNIERFVYMTAGDARTGMTLQSMTPQLSRYFGLNDKTGALVGAVSEGSSAAEAGLQAGDVVVSIDGEKVGSPLDAHKLINQKKEGSVEVRVIRDKQEKTFTVKLSGKPMDLDLPELNEIEQLRGPIEMFRSFPEGQIELEQELINPDADGEADEESDLSEMKSTHPRMMVIRPHARTIPAPEHEVRREAPTGL